MSRVNRTMLWALMMALVGTAHPGSFLYSLRASSEPQTANEPPLSLDDVLKLLEGRVRPARIKTIVAERGVDFSLNNATEKRLRSAGATDDVIIEIAKSYRQPTKPPAKTVPTPEIETPRRSAAGPAPGTVRTNSTDGLQYVWIPPGTFLMGCSPGDTECYDWERPQHQVTLTRGFWMGQTEVTVAAYKRFANATGRAMPWTPAFNNGWTNDDMPVVNVTWHDAQGFCGWSGGRLPTEAEWEYAARGGHAGARDGDIDSLAWYESNSAGRTHAVGQKRSSAFAMYDTLGNVWEWVNDWYDGTYFRNSPSQDPRGPSGGQFRVLRGGSWSNDASLVRASNRISGYPEVRNHFNGLRCVGEVNLR